MFPAGHFNATDAAAMAAVMGAGSNMANLRDWEEQQIDGAFDDGNYGALIEDCAEALADPSLDDLRRAKYELYLASCPGQDTSSRVQNAQIILERMQQDIENGIQSKETVQQLKPLRDMAKRILDTYTPVSADEEMGSVKEAGKEDKKPKKSSNKSKGN